MHEKRENFWITFICEISTAKILVSCSSVKYTCREKFQVYGNPSREIVKQAFNILAGSEPFTKLAENLPPPLCNCTTDKVDSTNWTIAQTWIEWWTHPQILKKHTVPWILMTGMSFLELTIQLNL